MRHLRLLSTTAAIVLLGSAAAMAQGVKNDEAPTRAPAAHQNAPAEKIAPAMKHSENKGGEKTGQGTTKTPVMTGAAKPEEKSKAKATAKDDTETHGKSADAKRDTMAKEHVGSGDAAKSSDKSANEGKRSTAGQGAGAGSAKLSGEQRTKITTIFKQHRVESARLNISARVGNRVPESIHFYRMPAEVYAVYPEWRGYDYIMVGDEILVVDPRSHEIVAILEA